ncbi:MAG: hypothetical protein JXB00_19615 [Bacteroidales bacterium]|nr:hypothetical protein [Bacteroidales bacterium]
MRLIKLLYFLCLLLFSCKSSLQKQADYLLPNNYKIHLLSKKEVGITNFYIYKVDKQIIISEIIDFPIQIISKEDKSIVKWHSPSNDELSDIVSFIKEEQNNTYATNIFSHLPLEEIMIALIYDNDKSPLGNNKYSVYDWMELYILDTKNGKIIHISYGDF